VTHQLWGGRFSVPPSMLMRRLNDSFSFDRDLIAEDITGSIGWARALGRAGVLSDDEVSKLVAALESLASQGAPATSDAEDVHSYVEAELYKLVGPLAGKLHTGRSRNDQVATDLKLWLKNAAAEADVLITGLAKALALKAQEEAGTPMPGYTHLKRAEPVTFGHWCLAYVEMLLRDRSRLRDAIARGDECPLGSGALSGSPIAVDRDALAHDLGFARATSNSLDGVSDRDFAVEYLFVASMLFTHLSRLAEDLIFFSSDEAGYATLPDAFSTGSSRMPQKKNPDVLELARGYAGRQLGELTGMLALLKGLPLAYDKDLQLDKEPLFRTRVAIGVTLPALGGLIEGLVIHRDVTRDAASHDLLLATELADAIASRGIPFREAHDITSARVAEALKAKVTLRELGPSEQITAADLEAIDVDRALAKRTTKGGTSPENVRAAAEVALKVIG
jgi:argininosuccinate lyase